MINHLTLVGGTHGDEQLGISLINYWQKTPRDISFPSFKTQLILANNDAINENRRYIKHDLNRCFLIDDLKDSSLNSCEQIRAKEIYRMLGPKENPKTDFIVDIHSTTSNMGITLIIEYYDYITFQLAVSLKKRYPYIRVLFSNIPQEKDLPFLYTITKKAILIEVGPIPHNTLLHNWFLTTKEVIEYLFSRIHLLNLNLLENYSECEVFIPYKDVFYPQKRSQCFGVVHELLQGKDFHPLKNNNPIFYNFDGEIIYYNGKTSYPVFINEASYKRQNIAFQLTKNKIIKLTEVI